MLNLALLDTIDNTPENNGLPGALLNLGPYKKGESDGFFLIEIPKEDPDKPTRMLEYIRAPIWMSVKELDTLSTELKIYVIPKKNKPSLSDQDRIALATNDQERTKIQQEISRRDNRHDIIFPLLRRSENSQAVRSAVEIITDKDLPAKVRKLARRGGPAVGTIYKLLHLYFARGCVKDALCTGYPRCGCPGKRRTQQNSLGRKSRAYRRGQTPHRCYVLDKGKPPEFWDVEVSDRKKLAWGWRLIRHGYTREEAFDLTSAVFWAIHGEDERGKVRARLWPPHLRPTFRQFEYWGRILNGDLSATEMILGPRKFSMLTETHGGSEQDQVTTVGQLAVFDGTSTDVYLTSMLSRLKKLPPQLRLIIKDVRTGVYCGWYLGWGPASPQKAIQAILHAASPKVEEAERLDIHKNVDAIPVILHRTYQADHGELKAETVTEFEEQTGVGIEYVSTGRGDKKPGAETTHHKDHKSLDHKLPGTTKGRQRERGEDHPALGALFNSFEYRREMFLAAIENNLEVVPELAPADMVAAHQEKPELGPLTRISIFNWLRRHQSAEAPADIELLRALALPDVEAVIRKNGIYPLMDVLGSKVLIPLLRYKSEDPTFIRLMSAVKRTKKVIRTRMKIDQDPNFGWLPTKAGLIPLQLASRRESTRARMNWGDWVAEHEDRLSASDATRAERQQSNVDKLLRREDTRLNAQAERDAEIEKLGKKPSKLAQVKNLKKNLADELAGRAERDVATKSSGARLSGSELPLRSSPSPAAPLDDPASIAMRRLNDEEFPG